MYIIYYIICDCLTISELSCGVLETPQYGRKSNFFFYPGTKVVFECNQNYILVGDQKRVCSPQGKWEPPEYGYTECLRKYYLYNIMIST